MYDIIFYPLKKRYILLAVLTLGSLLTYSQQLKIDSLKTVLNNQSGVNKYETLISIVRERATIDDKEAYKWALKARLVAYQFRDSSKIVNSSRIIGQLLNRLNQPKEAEKILLEIIPVAKRNNLRDEYKILLNNLALAYTIQAKYDQALNVNFQALLLREEDKDNAEISISLNNIGLVYFKLKNYDKALEFYYKALKLKKEINDNYILDHLLINIGLCYNQLNDFSKAHSFFNEAFKVCGNGCSEQVKVDGKFGLGVSYFGLGEFSKAQDYFTESYLIAKKIGNRRFQAENLIYLAHIFVHQKDGNSAIKVLNECEEIAIEAGYNQILIEAYKEFSNVYNQSRDFENASLYQNKYIHLKDSIYSETLITNLAKVQADFEERENKAIIATNEEVIQRQKKLNIAVAVIMLLAFFLIFVLYHSNNVKKKVNHALSEAKSFIELKNKELDQKVADKTADLEVANDSLTKVNEELDNFIYKTSHDIRGPLASLKGICNVALMDIRDPTALEYLYKLDITAEHLNSTLTRLMIINQINNSAVRLEKINFDAVIDDIVAIERKKVLPLRLEMKKSIQPDIDFYSDKEFMRIILENLIDNAVKFHNDSERVNPIVEICIMQNEDHLKLSVLDNGIGVNGSNPDKIFQMFSRASARSNTGGIGLYITKTATEKLGGLLGVTKTPEGLTEFYVRFPMKPAWVDEQFEVS